MMMKKIFLSTVNQFLVSIKYPVSTWVVKERKRTSFSFVDEFATFCPKNELTFSSVSGKNECDH